MRTKKFRTHYDNLKVMRGAPPEVIRAAYKALAQRYHPDRNPGNERAARIMQVINASYAVLSDPAARAAHDAWIAEQEKGSEPVFSTEDNVEDNDEVIRAEPRRYTEQPEGDTSRSSIPSSSVGSWIANKVRAVVVALLISMAIGAIIKLPRMVSRVEQANQLSSSRRPVQSPRSTQSAATSAITAVATEEQFRSAMCALTEMPKDVRARLRAAAGRYVKERDEAKITKDFDIDEIPYHLSKCFREHANRTMASRRTERDFAHFYGQSERAMRLILTVDAAMTAGVSEELIKELGGMARTEIQHRNDSYYR